MSDLDLGIRQLPAIPDRTLVLVKGWSGVGKTTFACHVALRAVQAGQRVTFIEPEHSFRKNVLSYAITRLMQDPVASPRLREHPDPCGVPSVRLVSLVDSLPYLVADFERAIEQALRMSDLVILDELPRALFLAEDTEGLPDEWFDQKQKLLLKALRAAVCTKTGNQRALVTYSVARPPNCSRILTEPLDRANMDPVPGLERSYPVAVDRAPNGRMMAWELRRLG